MTKRLSVVVVAVLFILLLIAGFASAITGSIGNAKMVLYPEVNGFTYTKIEKSILVRNVNDEPINVNLKIDEETGKFIELLDESFVLDIGEEKDAEFIVKVRKEGTYDGKINIFFSSVNESKKTGVALSSQVIVIAKRDQGYKEANEDTKKSVTNKSKETTGSVITGSEEVKSPKTSNSLVLMIGSALFLLAVLLVLLVIMLKKRKKSDKRRNGINGRKRARRRS